MAGAAKVSPAKHDGKAARAEFLKILAWWNAGDVAAFTTYGATLVIDNAALTAASAEEFVRAFAPDRSRKDFRPAKLSSFDRNVGEPHRFIYFASVEHYLYVEDYCYPNPMDHAGGEICSGAPGYQFSIEGWYAFFDQGRIVRLQQTHRIA